MRLFNRARRSRRPKEPRFQPPPLSPLPFSPQPPLNPVAPEDGDSVAAAPPAPNAAPTLGKVTSWHPRFGLDAPGDLIVVSNDGVAFRVHRADLVSSSAVLQGHLDERAGLWDLHDVPSATSAALARVFDVLRGSCGAHDGLDGYGAALVFCRACALDGVYAALRASLLASLDAPAADCVGVFEAAAEAADVGVCSAALSAGIHFTWPSTHGPALLRRCYPLTAPVPNGHCFDTTTWATGTMPRARAGVIAALARAGALVGWASLGPGDGAVVVREFGRLLSGWPEGDRAPHRPWA